jgi:hypothetical protein
MMSKQQLLSLLAASSLAAFMHGCGSNEANEPSEPEAHADSGGEAEAACGGGACGAVHSDEQESP